MKRFVLYISTVTLMILFFISCSNDEDKGNYLTGTVDYSGESDGGIVVNLYSYPEINDTLAQIRYDYPQIGVNCTDQKLRELLFDKNAQPAVASTTTNSKGKWELKNLESGEFVLVFSKNHAYKFIYNQKVGGGENNIGKVELTKAIELKDDATITQDMIVPSGSNLYIEGVATVDEFRKLTIEDGVNIVFADSTAELDKGGINVLADAEIEFLGKEDSWINVFGESDSLKNGWSRIKIGDSGKGKFRYSRMSNGKNAVFYLKSAPNIENCIFLECVTGLGFEMNRGGGMNKLLISSNDFGLYGYKIDSLKIEESIFIKNKTGFYPYENSNYLVTTSAFVSNISGIDIGYRASGWIKNNIFEYNSHGIDIGYHGYNDNTISRQKVISNSFKNNINTDIQINSHIGLISRPIINYNNFFDTNINIKISEDSGTILVIDDSDIDCRYNWWSGESDSLSIYQNSVFYNDKYNIFQQGKVVITPFFNEEILNAGIK